ncbi:MAG TPA: 3-oxoacyl-[acyl-carrier-protein] synthase III C-terminal domain-containing protein [Verrucomicrobiales bacterium]|nr:3-oxoacyl-[acyl-carrier-protein] synthase III C-terminal domain-containing protein [Verrucomicrobiales bacterium]
MFLLGLDRAIPPLSYSQEECFRRIQATPAWERLRPESLDLLEKILLGNSGIRKRHFAVEDVNEILDFSAQRLYHEFERHAPALAADALGRALKRAGQGLEARDLDALFVCTCTGYLCPGVSSYVAERLGMRDDVYLQDLVGLGCGAAIPALRAARDFLTTKPDGLAAVAAVEVCSAAFYVDDDPGVLVSMCLFGDGASGSVWTGLPGNGSGLRAESFRALHWPKDREKIRFVNRDGKLCNQLHRSVPVLAARAVESLFGQRDGTRPVDAFISHGGGRDVLEALGRRIAGFDFAESLTVLREYGNLSSPSVLFALQERLESGASDERLWLTSFGAGFACHACELTAC